MLRTTAITAAALMLSGIPAGTAQAQFPPVQPALVQQANRQLIQTYQVLESTKNVLLLANNDYGAHKNAAINSIVSAQNRILVSMGLQPVARAAKANERPGARREPQAVSDQQLANAIAILGNTGLYLQNNPGVFPGQKIAAIRDLQSAQIAIQKALQYSQQNNY